MKKIFTLIFALLSVTSTFATDAEELAYSEFTGTGSVTIGTENFTVADQSIVISQNDNKELVNVKLSQGAILFKYGFISLTITLTPESISEMAVTKSGTVYSFDPNKTFTVVLDNGGGSVNTTGQFSVSELDPTNKTAKLTLHLTNLGRTISSIVGEYLDAKYDLTLKDWKPTGIEDVKASESTKAFNGKFMKNGKLTIVNNGKEYNAAGQLIK